MGIIEKIKKRGISVKRFNQVLCIFAVIISIAMFFAMHLTSALYNETHSITEHMVNWIDSSYGMQLASDYLTEQVRCFVISGDRKYLDNYFEEANVTRRREKALDTLKRVEIEEKAYDNLSQAMDESVALMDTEYYASRLAVAGYGYNVAEYPEEIQSVKLKSEDLSLGAKEQIERAETMLFDTHYRKTKETISEHMRDCVRVLVEDLSADRLRVANRLKTQMFLEHVLTALLIVTLLLSVIIASSQVLHPLQQSVDYIRKDLPVPQNGAYELRFLAKTYNVMFQANREKNERLVYEASHDKLTGLYNRRGYEFLLENLDMETTTILMVDLDSFKQVNDNFGHDKGDAVLVRVASVLKKTFKTRSYICRLGGDEFVVLLVHTDKRQREEISRLVGKINEKLQTPKNDLPVVSVSVGVAFGASDKENEELFKEADSALYKVKENGKKGIAFYDEK